MKHLWGPHHSIVVSNATILTVVEDYYEILQYSQTATGPLGTCNQPLFSLHQRSLNFQFPIVQSIYFNKPTLKP